MADWMAVSAEASVVGSAVEALEVELLLRHRTQYSRIFRSFT